MISISIGLGFQNVGDNLQTEIYINYYCLEYFGRVKMNFKFFFQ